MTMTPQRVTKRWTVDEYDRLGEAGFLPGHYELIDGEIIEKMPPNPPHVIALTLLTVWLHSVFGGLRVRVQAPIALPDIYYKPEPDAAVTTEDAHVYFRQHPGPNDLALVAEVSDSTLNDDLTTKAAFYAQAGIVEYWVLDIAGRCLHVHTGPEAYRYRRIQIYGETESVSVLARPDLAVPVSALLPPA